MRKVCEVSIKIPEGRAIDAELLLKQLATALRGIQAEGEETYHVYGEGIVMTDDGEIIFRPPKPKTTKRLHTDNLFYSEGKSYAKSLI